MQILGDGVSQDAAAVISQGPVIAGSHSDEWGGGRQTDSQGNDL